MRTDNCRKSFKTR